MFRTADDIQSPGADGIYGTADDIKGVANPNYVNHTSPYIDQSQTYGSDDTTTNHSDTHWTPVPGNSCRPLFASGQVDAYVLQKNT
jgi:hypothetical protein